MHVLTQFSAVSVACSLCRHAQSALDHTAQASRARPRCGACRRPESVVLSPRNVQAFRTLHNATHALFEQLGPRGWRAVLSALLVLDAVLCSPATTTSQKAATAAASPRKNSDLVVLETANAQLFLTAEGASARALGDLMAALDELSASTSAFVQVPLCTACFTNSGTPFLGHNVVC